MLSNLSRTATRRVALTRTFATTLRVQVAKIQIAGMVGNDMDVIETQSGTQIGNYSVASDKTSWFRVTAFNPNEYVRDKIKKGTLVFVDGDVSMEKYQDEASGKTLSAIRIVQRNVSVLRNPQPKQEEGTETAAGSA